MNPFNSIVRYSLRVLMLVFLLSSFSWVPQVYHFLILFFSVSLPNIISMAMAPKSLFIVSNLIVIFLVGESKLGKCTKKDEYYCTTGNEKVEYFGMERKMLSLSYEISKETNVGIIEENKEVEVVALVEEKDIIVDIVDKREEISTQEDVEEEGERECEEMEMREDEELERQEDEEELEREEEEMEGWPAEELNKKVEDFIAKFNMQIRLEARMDMLEARMAISCY